MDEFNQIYILHSNVNCEEYYVKLANGLHRLQELGKLHQNSNLWRNAVSITKRI